MSFFTEFQTLNLIRIPRCYFYPNHSPIIREIHGFSDASEHTYAAVLYLRAVNKDGGVVTRLIASKTRVAPVKRQSIPLLACGLDAGKLLNCNMWWEGPPFLKSCKEEWPKQLGPKSDDIALSELLKTSPQETHVLSTVIENTIVDLDDFIDV